MSKIKFKDPKYILPLIVLPFIFLFNYLILDFFPKEEVLTSLEDKEEMNLSLPTPNMDKIGIDDKMDNLKNTFDEATDFSAISENIKEGEIINDVEESLYSTDEAAELQMLQDSIANAKSRRNNFNPVAVKQESVDEAQSLANQKRNLRNDPKPLTPDQQFVKEMKMLDSVLNPEKYVKEQLENEVIKPIKETPAHVVTNAKNISNPYFNNVSGSNSLRNIEGLLDEQIKVYLGSRVRIKLASDIVIEGINVKKNSYIYGIVSNFKAQRIEIKVSSIIVNNEIYEVDLDVYDMDGIKGLYVPSSKFRDFAQELGAETSQSSSSAAQSDEKAFMLDLMSEVAKTTSKTVSALIKKNKANLKYNTKINLINNKIK